MMDDEYGFYEEMEAEMQRQSEENNFISDANDEETNDQYVAPVQTIPTKQETKSNNKRAIYVDENKFRAEQDKKKKDFENAKEKKDLMQEKAEHQSAEIYNRIVNLLIEARKLNKEYESERIKKGKKIAIF